MSSISLGAALYALLAVTASCTQTIAKQKPRAWYSGYSPSPTCGWSDGYGSEWECGGPVKAPPPPRVYTVGSRIDVGTSWTGFCRTRESNHNGTSSWVVDTCNSVDVYEAVLICDNPACRVDRSPAGDREVKTGKLTATLTAAGSYPMRVRFITDGKQAEITLPTLEAVLPDAVVAACASDNNASTVKISVMRSDKVLPSSVELTLQDGTTCTPTGSVLEPNASFFECPVAERIEGTITTPTITKPFVVACQH